MSLSPEAIQRAKALLGSDDLYDIQSLREGRLREEFGGDGWLDDNDDFESRLESWGLTSEYESAFTAAVDAGDSGQELVRWFQELFHRWAGAAPADAGVRYQNVSEVEGYPGWWQAWDSQAGSEDAWSYVRSGGQPDDSTDGWMDQATAFAAMQAEAQPESAGVPVEPLPAEVVAELADEVIAPAVEEVLDGLGDLSEFSEEEVVSALNEALRQLAEESNESEVAR